MFAIRKIIVHDICHKGLLKILKPGEYVFTDSKYDHFFLEGVTLCSVVGKNGCGKSSLIDLIFRMVNNLGAMMLRNVERPAAETLYFVAGIEADLYFELDGVVGILSCTSDSVKLSHKGHSFEWSLADDDCKYKVNSDEKKSTDAAIAFEIANHFFYLIATNYSMQAFISADYMQEVVYAWQPILHDGGESKELAWKKEDGCWIDSVFHKNDGYLCPIVLNPYRENGTIDMKKEARLTTNRLCALLLQTQKEDFEIVEGYRLAFVTYWFNQAYMLEKFDAKLLRDIPAEKVSDKFLYVYLMENSYAKAVLDGYGIDATKAMNYIELTLRLYLVYKTFSIANKYPQYSHFKPLGNIDNAFKSNPNPNELKLARELAETINRNHSHIELKVHQTIDLINYLNDSPRKNVFDRRMTYEDYNKLLGIDPQCETVLDRLGTLPPPLFKPEIYLIKTEDFEKIAAQELGEGERKKSIAEKAIPLSRLSSGERQFIYMTSTLLYHALNIQSIPKEERLAYRNICMVLDEVEICFHPEYQRTFINSLLSLFRRIKLNETFGINVIVVTHSPFVLSDIPKGNILYLAKGENVTEKIGLNTFGANVNELLNQSFFLSGGFMGEFAQVKIESLVKYLNEGVNDDGWNEENAKAIIDLVGDEVIQYQLQQLYTKRFGNSEFYKNWIRQEAQRLGL